MPTGGAPSRDSSTARQEMVEICRAPMVPEHIHLSGNPGSARIRLSIRHKGRRCTLPLPSSQVYETKLRDSQTPSFGAISRTERSSQLVQDLVIDGERTFTESVRRAGA